MRGDSDALSLGNGMMPFASLCALPMIRDLVFGGEISGSCESDEVQTTEYQVHWLGSLENSNSYWVSIATHVPDAHFS